MDTFTVMLGVTTFATMFLGETKKVGAYLWIAALFAILFAFRMAEPGFYIVSAALAVTLILRTQNQGEDIADEDDLEFDD